MTEVNKENDNSGKVERMSAHRLSKHIIGKYTVIKLYGNPHIYNSINGFYEPLIGLNAEYIIRNIIPENQKDFISINTIKEIQSWIISSNLPDRTEGYNICRYRYINFIDCYYDLVTDKIFEHCSQIIFTSYINVKLKNHTFIKETPVFNAVLQNICRGDMSLEMLLLEHFGYIVSGIRDLKNFTVLYGPKDTGKSLWLNIYKMTVGNDFVSSISIQQLSERFMVSELYQKKLNICGDLDKTRFDVGMLKRLTGNDTITGDIKNQKPVTFVNEAALAFGSNTLDFLTNSADPQNAVFERLVILPFLNVIDNEKRIEGVERKIYDELPSVIYYYVIPALKRLIAQNFIFTFCLKARQVKSQIDKYEQGILSFITDLCVFGEEYKCHTYLLYDYYCNYCKSSAFPIAPKEYFIKYLMEAYKLHDFVPMLEKQKFRLNGEHRHGIKGVGLKQEQAI